MARLFDCDIVFQYDNVDPIYQHIGLEMDADSVEIIERGCIDLDRIVAACEHYEMTQVFFDGEHSFFIDVEFDYFCTKWKTK